MAKYFEVDFRKGSFNDTMGRTVTVTGSPEIKRGEKGNYISTLHLSKYLYYSSQIIPNNAFTVVCFFKAERGNLTLFNNSSGGWSIQINQESTTIRTLLYCGSGNYKYFNYTKDFKWHCFILTIPGSAQTDINYAYAYLDGVQLLDSSIVATSPQPVRTDCIYIGRGNAVTNNFTNIAYLATYDHVFTEAERAKAYQDFLNSYPIVPEKFPQPSIINKPLSLTHLKDTGLVAGYNMIPQGNTLVDISGNRNNAALNGVVVSTKNGLKFKNSSSYAFITEKVLSTTWTVNFRGSLNNLTSDINANIVGTDSYGIKPNYNSLFYFRSIDNTYYSFGSYTQINVDKPLTISLVSNGTTISFYLNGVYITAVTPDNITLKAKYIMRCVGEAVDLHIYNRALFLSEIKAYHNSFVNTYLKEDFSSEGADGLAKVPSGWVKQSGSFKIDVATADDANLKTIKKGTKFLQCVTAGIIALPSKQAYGTWEWDWYKGADGNLHRVKFISPNISLSPQNTYSITLTSVEGISFVKFVSGVDTTLCLTGAAYLSNNVWYRVKITRSLTGVFTLLIKGGAFTPTAGYDGWTLVSITGGSGTNPVTDTTYTTSEYFVLDLDAGDRIANICLTDGIKQL